MGSGISVLNDTEFPLLIVASQLTPLHWGRVEPGETWNPNNVKGMGRVWFTMSTSLYDQTKEPTIGEVAGRIAVISLVYSTPFFIPFAAYSGITSTRGVSIKGCYSVSRARPSTNATGL